jgi:hypothetical protein
MLLIAAFKRGSKRIPYINNKIDETFKRLFWILTIEGNK